MFAQSMKERRVAWIIPAIATRINGLAGGLIINSLKYEGDSLTTVVNGVCIEVLGLGVVVPLAEPIFWEHDSIYQNIIKRDSIFENYYKIKYKINGLSLSPGGLGGRDIALNGLNISVLNTLTGKVNGASFCFLFNYSGVVNGISAAIFNGTLQTKGLQIGIINHTTKLRGFQLGLWNKNEKRSLPFVNWNWR